MVGEPTHHHPEQDPAEEIESLLGQLSANNRLISDEFPELWGKIRLLGLIENLGLVEDKQLLSLRITGLIVSLRQLIYNLELQNIGPGRDRDLAEDLNTHTDGLATFTTNLEVHIELLNEVLELINTKEDVNLGAIRLIADVVGFNNLVMTATDNAQSEIEIVSPTTTYSGLDAFNIIQNPLFIDHSVTKVEYNSDKNKLVVYSDSSFEVRDENIGD